MQRDNWALRCASCGQCASGHGPMPEHADQWICGQCQVDLDSAMIDLDCSLGT